MTGIIERSGIDLLLLDGDGTSPFGAGVMGKMGKNFVGNLALSVHEFPHFSLKITVVTNKLSPLIVIFYMMLSSKYNYHVYYKKSTKYREMA